jgi:membrane associated rhomboid family serine protease
MQQPPSPMAFLRYPVTTCVTVLAILGTVQFVSSPADVEQFLSNTGDCLREPWRLLVPALFHEGVIHLLFNLYWLWFFGTKVEDEFGHFATVAILLVLATGSMAAELALFRGGIGLSGIGYGLFGMLWVLGRTDPRFRDTVDHSVVELMLGWLLVCIILTMADVWHVGNVAHCAGCLLGALLGWTISARGVARRLRNGVILTIVFLAFLAGGTVARPYVNLFNDTAGTLYQQAAAALNAGQTAKAIDLYEKAIDIDPNRYSWWKDLATAYRMAGRSIDASRADQSAEKVRRQGPAKSQ